MREHAIFSKAFDSAAIEILTRKVVLGKKDLTSCGSLSSCTLKPYCSVCGGCRIFGLALKSNSVFSSVYVAINVTLPFCVWAVLDVSHCFMSERTALGGRWNRVKVTVLFCFASSFWQVAVLQAL